MTETTTPVGVTRARVVSGMVFVGAVVVVVDDAVVVVVDDVVVVVVVAVVVVGSRVVGVSPAPELEQAARSTASPTRPDLMTAQARVVDILRGCSDLSTASGSPWCVSPWWQPSPPSSPAIRW
jgi:hypothetical protein